MKIQYASDLHLEFDQQRTFVYHNKLKPVADILILAGDICYLKEEHFKFEFFEYVSNNWEHTYIIPGNHEFYKHSFDIAKVLPTFQLSVRDNIEYINNSVIEIDDIRFIFTTLWTKIINTHLIESAMNDFRICTYEGRRFTTREHNICNMLALDFLTTSLVKSTNCHKTIVVSHHVPFSANYCNYPFVANLNEGFHIDMSSLYQQHDIDYWIYGHNHLNQKSIQMEGTTFLTNQLGYVFREENKNFDGGAFIDV